MALVCDCGYRLDISADERERLAATGEGLTCPHCGKSRKVRPQPANVGRGFQQLKEEWANEWSPRLSISWFWMTIVLGMPIIIGIAIAIAEYSTRSPVVQAPKSSTAARNRVVAKREAPSKPAEVPPQRGNEPDEGVPVIVPFPAADAPPEPGPLQLQRRQASVVEAEDQKRLNVRRGLGVSRSTVIDELKETHRLEFKFSPDFGRDCYAADFRGGFVQLNGPEHDLDGISIGCSPDAATQMALILFATKEIVAPGWDSRDFAREFQKAAKALADGKVETIFSHDPVRVRACHLNFREHGNVILFTFMPVAR